METISFELNGQTLDALDGETILQVADRSGIKDIPRLCYKEGYRADGNCRSCVVEIEGERVLAPSCCRYPQHGMKVNSKSKRAIHSQKMVLELLLDGFNPNWIIRILQCPLIWTPVSNAHVVSEPAGKFRLTM